MKLLVQTKSIRQEETIEFYRSLGWVELGNDLVTNGKLLIRISTDPKDRIGLVVMEDSASKRENILSQYRNTSWKDGHIVQAPSGCFVHMIEKLDLPEPDSSIQALPGSYAGVSLESVDMDASIKFWQMMGYNITMGGIEHGWAALSNDHNDTISVMAYGSCPHSFINPSLTYFNAGKNPEIIQELRSKNIPIEEEITIFNPQGEVDNVFLRDPGGLGFFVFNDG